MKFIALIMTLAALAAMICTGLPPLLFSVFMGMLSIWACDKAEDLELAP